MAKKKWLTAINTSDGRRFEKGIKVVQIPAGGEAEVVDLIDEDMVRLHIHTPNGRPFPVLSPVRTLLPVTEEQSKKFADALNGGEYTKMEGANDENSLDEPVEEVETPTV